MTSSSLTLPLLAWGDQQAATLAAARAELARAEEAEYVAQSRHACDRTRSTLRALQQANARLRAARQAAQSLGIRA